LLKSVAEVTLATDNDTSGAEWLRRLAPRKIAVFRALQLGDLLCATPAFRALRAALPQAHLALVGLPWAALFARRFADVFNEFIEFPGWPGLPESEPRLSELAPFLTRMQEQAFDLVLQMHGDGSLTNSIVTLFGARASAGFARAGAYRCPRGRYLEYPQALPEIWRNLKLLEWLGIPAHGEELEFREQANDDVELCALPEHRLLEAGRYVCLHPGAREPKRRWHPDRFAHVGQALASAGFRVVLTGSESERELTGAVNDRMRGQAIDLAGKTSLGALTALLREAALLICNDTGVSHLAAALRIPSVVIFWSSEREGWPPSDHRLHRAVSRLGGVEPRDVLREAFDLLWSGLNVRSADRSWRDRVSLENRF
jgi:ADP-heptose:LPS heptosyltransferase